MSLARHLRLLLAMVALLCAAPLELPTAEARLPNQRMRQNYKAKQQNAPAHHAKAARQQVNKARNNPRNQGPRNRATARAQRQTVAQRKLAGERRVRLKSQRAQQAARSFSASTARVGRMLPKGVWPKRKARESLAKDHGPISSAMANALHKVRGNKLPYKKNSRARDIVLKRDALLVRAHGPHNQARSWLLRPKDLKRMGYSGKKLQDHYALPSKPTHFSYVRVKAGTRLTVGTAGGHKEWGRGGGIQYEIRDILPKTKFFTPRKLRN